MEIQEMSKYTLENVTASSINSPVREGGSRHIVKRYFLDVAINISLVMFIVMVALSYYLPIFSNVLYAPQQTYNFGAVRAGALVHHTFLVRNLHPWSVTVNHFASSCGCTTTTVGKKLPFRLGPLCSFATRVDLNTLGKKGDVIQTVYIATSDNGHGTALRLQGAVQ